MIQICQNHASREKLLLEIVDFWIIKCKNHVTFKLIYQYIFIIRKMINLLVIM